VEIARRFAKALDGESGDPDDPAGLDRLPEQLARAAAAVLPVDGVGLSVHGDGDLRMPLAASSEVAAIAESLQFTAGHGPCLLAAESGYPVFATEGLLARRWPRFHDLLVTKTPVRSVLALSLPGRLRGLGGMDLYFHAADGPMTIDIFEARRVAALLSARLGPAADWAAWTTLTPTPWGTPPAARRRARLWIATGMVIAARQVPADEALALLRGRAHAENQTVDDLAAELVDRRLPPDRLRLAPDADD